MVVLRSLVITKKEKALANLNRAQNLSSRVRWDQYYQLVKVDGGWPKIRQFHHKTAWCVHHSQIGHDDC
jgi:hypothetical protein